MAINARSIDLRRLIRFPHVAAVSTIDPFPPLTLPQPSPPWQQTEGGAFASSRTKAEGGRKLLNLLPSRAVDRRRAS